MNGRAVGDRQARSPECLAKLDIGGALPHCVTGVRPVGCGALFWRAFRDIVRRGPCVVCRVVVVSLCGLFMLSRRTSIIDTAGHMIDYN